MCHKSVLLRSIVVTMLFLFFANSVQAQKAVYFKTNNVNSILVKLNNDPGEFPFDAIPSPYEMGLPKNSKLDFILPKDSLTVILKEKIIINICRQERKDTIKLIFYPVEIITFDKSFQQKKQGKTNIEVPEVYELMNVLIAISPSGMADKNLIYTISEYYNQVLKHFSRFKNEKAVRIVDSLLRKDNYFNLKMDSYSFLFNKGNTIIPHPNYHVINWSNINAIDASLLKELNAFAQKSGFRNFFTSHKKLYQEQVDFYKKKVNLSQMVNWLSAHFPSTKYNYYNVLFSPLVNGNQSTQQFEDNGFKEAQLHVNFPYYNKEYAQKIKGSYPLYRGNVLFTELNHNFINPEADKYASKIKSILSDLSKWEEKGKAAQLGYAQPMSCFNEYMNWGLVSLYLHDYANPSDMPVIIETLNDYMVNYRGFTKFQSFQAFLLSTYKNRKSKTTIADLYPTIIDWFKENQEEKVFSFIKQIHQTELADSNFILVDEPFVFDDINCLGDLWNDSSFYTKEDIELINEKIRPSSFIWSSDMFGGVRIVTKNSICEIFNDKRKGWSHFQKDIGKGYYTFSLPIFLKKNKYCLFYSDYHCGYECGGGHFKLYRNEKGKWTEVKTYCQWIS